MNKIFQFLFVVFCLFTTSDPLNAQWVQTNGPSYVSCFAVSPASGGAGSTYLFAGTYLGGVYRSSDNDTNWTAVNIGLTSATVSALVVSPTGGGVGGTNLFAASNDGIFLSTNNGSSWSAINTELTSVSAFALSGTNLFAANSGSVYRSSDNGASWSAVNGGMVDTAEGLLQGVTCLAVSGTNLYAANWGPGILRSTNNGASWTEVNLGLPTDPFDPERINSIYASGTNLFAGSTWGYVYRSGDNGISWMGGPSIYSHKTYYLDAIAFANYGTNFFVGTWRGVYGSVNGEDNWVEAGLNTAFPTAGFTNTYVRALAVLGTNLFAGTFGVLWRRPMSEIFTSVATFSADLPTHFSLDQNYPNPFNPSTTIRFSLPKTSKVNLKIYNMLGQRIAELVNDEVEAGYREVVWNTNVASGIYLYQIDAVSVNDPNSRFVQVKKMLLLR